ncbi:MAG: hypothetical protein SGJ27_22170 [Candidatus Melainabacteria bacterium]|nr:hypothetical protein [Candidatus Melainabacteria bacterium]
MSRNLEAVRLRELALIAHVHANEGRLDEAQVVISWSPALQSLEDVLTATCPRHYISENETDVEKCRAFLNESEEICSISNYKFVRRFESNMDSHGKNTDNPRPRFRE